jgi:hypothetical protein
LGFIFWVLKSERSARRGTQKFRGSNFADAKWEIKIQVI